MNGYILKNATLVTSSEEILGTVVISGDKITGIFHSDSADYISRISELSEKYCGYEVLDLEGKHLMAGGIDAHVHFREPGLTHKADISTESMAAAAGGVTSVIDMPNTVPATTSADALSEKMNSAEGRSAVNIGFHIGATNRNHDEITDLLKGCTSVPENKVGGVKVFMGSSTGNMLVDEADTLNTLFQTKDRPVLVHCEDEATIKENLEEAAEKFGDNIPFAEHEKIRSRKACIKSSIKALEMAIKNNTKLVLCHISTKEEMEMVRAAKSNNPSIIAETSCNYLWFCNEDYERMGSHLKCNPSVKTAQDREALRKALAEGIIDTIGSDHAPHLLSEKEGIYSKVPSGLPSIQQSLPVLITIAEQEDIPLKRIAAVFSENASDLYGLKRGKIECGYYADIVIFDKDAEFIVKDDEQYSKCGWSPYKGERLKGNINMVFVNGVMTVKDRQIICDIPKAGKALQFNER